MKLFNHDFSLQEFIIGFLAPVALIAKLSLIQLAPVCIISSLLWALGGTFKTALRRFLLPFVPLLFMHPAWATLLAPVIGIAVLHIGDGFPDHRPTTADEGSWLGRQVEKVFPSDVIGGPITKWLILLIYQLSLIPYFL